MNICPRNANHKSKLLSEFETLEWASFVGQHRQPRVGIRRTYECLDCGIRWIKFTPYNAKERKEHERENR